MNQIVGIKPNGAHMLALVLEPGNLKRLQDGEPISVHIESLFPDGIPDRLDVRLYFSETPISDAREFARHATITFDERAAKKVRPHCPECVSTVEQLGLWRNDSPLSLIFCAICGCIFGTADAKATGEK